MHQNIIEWHISKAVCIIPNDINKYVHNVNRMHENLTTAGKIKEMISNICIVYVCQQLQFLNSRGGVLANATPVFYHFRAV